MIGKWNKSVILTYTGLSISVLGLVLMLCNVKAKYAFVCLMFAGICDLFDGTISRKCKRTEEEMAFGIELDSLVDAISFVALPIAILARVSDKLYYLPIYVIYSVFAIARLANFNIIAPHNNKAVKHYSGLPVTCAALIFPPTFLLSYIIRRDIFTVLYNIIALIVGVLFVSKIKILKPKFVHSIVILISAVVVTVIYLFVV